MYAGHFATALVLKAKVPEAPTWGILLGVGVLDLLFGPFVLLGFESVTLTPGQSPGFSLDQNRLVTFSRHLHHVVDSRPCGAAPGILLAAIKDRTVFWWKANRGSCGGPDSARHELALAFRPVGSRRRGLTSDSRRGKT